MRPRERDPPAGSVPALVPAGPSGSLRGRSVWSGPVASCPDHAERTSNQTTPRPGITALTRRSLGRGLAVITPRLSGLRSGLWASRASSGRPHPGATRRYRAHNPTAFFPPRAQRLMNQGTTGGYAHPKRVGFWCRGVRTVFARRGHLVRRRRPAGLNSRCAVFADTGALPPLTPVPRVSHRRDRRSARLRSFHVRHKSRHKRRGVGGQSRPSG